MGTRAKITVTYGDNYICSKYFNMDGHVRNWAPAVITALNQTTPESILANRQLFRFMCDDYGGSDHLDYSCKIDVSDSEYNVTIYRYKELLFQGTLRDFADVYDEL